MKSKKAMSQSVNSASAETSIRKNKKRKLSKRKKRLRREQLLKICAIFALYLTISTVIAMRPFKYVKYELATDDNTYIVETKINNAEWAHGKNNTKMLFSTEAGEYFLVPYDWSVLDIMSIKAHSELMQTFQSLIDDRETVYITVADHYSADAKIREAIEIKTDSQVIGTLEGYNSNQKSLKIIYISIAAIVLLFGLFRTFLALWDADIIII